MSKPTFGYIDVPVPEGSEADGPYLPHGPITYPKGLNIIYGFPDGPGQPRFLPRERKALPSGRPKSQTEGENRPKKQVKFQGTEHFPQLTSPPGNSVASKKNSHENANGSGHRPFGGEIDGLMALYNALDSGNVTKASAHEADLHGVPPDLREWWLSDGAVLPEHEAESKRKVIKLKRSTAVRSKKPNTRGHNEERPSLRWGGHGGFVAREAARRRDREEKVKNEEKTT